MLRRTFVAVLAAIAVGSLVVGSGGMNAAETLQALDQYAFVILPALLVAEQFGIPFPAAPALFHHLGRAGILVRNFPDNATWLRFGLPAGEEAWQRLQIAMDAFRNNG